MASGTSEKVLPTLRISYEDLKGRSEALSSGASRHDGTATKDGSSKDKSTPPPGLLYISPTKVVNTSNEGKAKRSKGRTQSELASRPPKLSTRQERHDVQTNGKFIRRTTQIADDAVLSSEHVRRKEPSSKLFDTQEERSTEPRRVGRDAKIRSDEGRSKSEGRSRVRSEGRTRLEGRGRDVGPRFEDVGPRFEERTKSEERGRDVGPRFEERTKLEVRSGRTRSEGRGRVRSEKDAELRAEGRRGELRKEGGGLEVEWGCHESKRIDRALTRWSGNVQKLEPLIEAW